MDSTDLGVDLMVLDKVLDSRVLGADSMVDSRVLGADLMLDSMDEVGDSPMADEIALYSMDSFVCDTEMEKIAPEVSNWFDIEEKREYNMKYIGIWCPLVLHVMLFSYLGYSMHASCYLWINCCYMMNLWMICWYVLICWYIMI